MVERKAISDRFLGKVAIVTGGSSGIGRAVVEELCKEGAKVVFSGISTGGRAVAQELVAQGRDVLFVQGDMGDETVCRELVAATLARFGRVDLLVNNAFAFTAKALDATAADWQRSYFAGPVNYARMIQNVVKPMQTVGGGAVVNVRSVSGHIAQKARWTYNMSKGAVGQLTKCAALDLAPYGIRVNSVSPAWIWSREVDKAADLDGGGREKWGPIWGDYHMLRRMGEAVECARPILFLLSDDASFITATDLPIDGGYLAMGPEAQGGTARVAGSN
jgi:NAD(P)-dependent dehydrogenase (short-subunit alcohol dehydrogenase family)